MARKTALLSPEAFDAYCASLPGTTMVIQWGGAHVWKVGGKVFAIGGWGDGETPAFTFKVTPLAFEILQEQPGLRPAPYLASRGMKWIQHHAAPGLGANDLKAYLKQSYDLIVAGLPKKTRAGLGV